MTAAHSPARPFVRAMFRETFCGRGVHLFRPVLRYHHRGPVVLIGAAVLPFLLLPPGWHHMTYQKCRACGTKYRPASPGESR